MQTVNDLALRGLTLSKRFVFEKREVSAGTSLSDLIGVALKDPSSAAVILDALIAELSLQTKYVSSFLHAYVGTYVWLPL